MRICKCGAKTRTKSGICSSCQQRKKKRVVYDDKQRKANYEYVEHNFGIKFENMFQELSSSCS